MGNKKYKPYKPNKTKDIYSKYDAKQKKNEDSMKGDNIKLFGFRTGKIYKMIPAFLYYSLILVYIVYSIFGEFMSLKFEPMDYVLQFFKYSFIIFAYLSPAIFLSDFKYVDNIPVFKKHNPVSGLISIAILVLFCYLMMQVDIYCMSNTYKESVKEYDKMYEQKMEKLNDKYNEEISSVTESTTIIEESTNEK